MIVFRAIIILIAICTISCENVSKSDVQQHLLSSENNVKQYSTTELLQKWDSLCAVKGCLTGGQRVFDGKWGGEGCAFSLDKSWQVFVFKTDKNALTEFLINQIPDKTLSQLHTCPHENATKGELAIYCLQGLYNLNFYDLSPNLKTIQQEGTKRYKSEQRWIWAIQSSQNKTSELQNIWINQINKSN